MNDPVLDLRLEQLELAAIEAESIGWQPLTTEAGESAYLHIGDPQTLVRREPRGFTLTIEKSCQKPAICARVYLTS